MWLSRRKKRWGLLGADYFWTPATEQIEEVKFSVHVGLSNQRKAIYFWELLQDWLPVVWSAVINLIWLLCQTLCKPPQNCYHAVCADGHVPGCHPAKVGSSRGHKVQGKPELLWSLFPPFLSCSLYVPLPSPKGGNLIYSCPHWYYWAKCSLEYSVALMWLHQTYLLLYREIVLLVSGTLPTYPAGLFHITKCLSCFLYILRSYHTVYYLHRFLCIQFGECLSPCGLRHQYKLRRPQRFLLMEDLCRKKK